MWETYKKNKGKWVRWIVFGCLALLLLFGMYRLYYTIPTNRDWAWAVEPIKIGETSLKFLIPYIEFEIILSIRLLFCIVGAIFALLFSYALVFIYKKFSDFLIETESEMRKVYWPSFREVLGSSIVIVITVAILGLYIFGIDVCLGHILDLILYTKK